MPARDQYTFARKSLPDLPGGVTPDQFAYMICTMMDYYNGLDTDITAQNMAKVISGTIHRLHNQHDIPRYVALAEADWLRNWLPECALWLMDHEPSKVAPEMALTRVEGKLVDALARANPLGVTMKELSGRLSLPKHRFYNARTGLGAEVEVVDHKGRPVVRRNGKGIAPPYDDQGYEYFCQEECQSYGQQYDPLYSFHAKAWGMRLYAQALVEHSYVACPRIPGLTLEWLLKENGADGLRAFMIARDYLGRTRAGSTRFVSLPTYDYDQDRGCWVLNLVSRDTLSPYCEDESVTTWGKFQRILIDRLAEMGTTIEQLPPSPTIGDDPLKMLAAQSLKPSTPTPPDASDDLLADIPNDLTE